MFKNKINMYIANHSFLSQIITKFIAYYLVIRESDEKIWKKYN